ncbi:MAG TPA: DUF6799 domain-containing protein [Flavisolibacter sp.]|nr:DUF6799 domain-containing protein [Flavisolibacter sp.]
MKKLFILSLVCFLGLTMQAQNNDKKMSGKKSMHMSKDCVMKEDGKMMMMKDGQTMAMDKDMTMQNGTVVMADGNVKMKNGKTMMLKDGDCVWMNGTVSHKKMGGMKKHGKM